MPITNAVNADDETRRLTLSTGVVLDLKLEDNSVGIFSQNTEVGRLSFRHYEEPTFGEEVCDVCRLTHAFLEGNGGRYKHHGVATEAVRFYLSATDCKLELPEDDGITKEDGSHLVNEGPAFVASLRSKQARGEL